MDSRLSMGMALGRPGSAKYLFNRENFRTTISQSVCERHHYHCYHNYCDYCNYYCGYTPPFIPTMRVLQFFFVEKCAVHVPPFL